MLSTDHQPTLFPFEQPETKDYDPEQFKCAIWQRKDEFTVIVYQALFLSVDLVEKAISQILDTICKEFSYSKTDFQVIREANQIFIEWPGGNKSEVITKQNEDGEYELAVAIKTK